MPTPLLNGSIITVTWWQTYQTQALLNVMHYQYSESVPVTDFRTEMGALGATFAAAGDANDSMAALASNSWELTYWIGQPVYPTRLKALVQVLTQPGTLVGTTTPSNVATTIVKEADVGKRWGTGTWHQGGLVATDVAGGVTSPGLQAKLTTLSNKLFSLTRTTANGTYSPVLWNMKNPGRVTPITASHLVNDSRVMRRRTHFLGI